jgi:hypothetical protein
LVTELAQAAGQRSRLIVIDAETGIVTPDRIFVHRSAKGFVCVGIGVGATLLERAERMRDVPDVKHRGHQLLDDPYLQRVGLLAKAYNADEPRVPAGNAGGGQWTSGGLASTLAAEAASLFETNSATVVAGLSAIASRLSAPTALLGTLFIPTNPSLISAGAVPGNAGVSFQFDRGTGVLTLSSSDNGMVLFSGRYGADGVFRDSTGSAIGRVVDGAVVLDPHALPGYATINPGSSSETRDGARAQATSADRAEPRLCPDPSFDRPGSNWSPRALAYQYYVTGLPPGFAIRLIDPATGRPVYLDGCRELDGVLLEAKGLGYKRFLDKDGNWKPWFKGLKSIINQAQRQSRAAAAIGRTVEWHVAEPEVAKAFAHTFESVGIHNVVVIYDPPPAVKVLSAIWRRYSRHELGNICRLLPGWRLGNLTAEIGRGDFRPVHDVE